LVNKRGGLVTTDVEKAEVLTKHFALVFNGNLSSYISPDPENQDRTGRLKALRSQETTRFKTICGI